MKDEAPEGYELIRREPGEFAEATGWFTLVGPLYRKTGLPAGQSAIRFFAGPKFRNAVDQAHGGMLAAFMDTVLVHAARGEGVPGTFVTLSMTVNYLSGAPLGEWIEGEGKVLRAGGQVVFAEGHARAGDKLIVHASGSFRKITRG
ncbi:MAG: PaaI family thioesterase [Caulobacterales bacterium]